MAAGRQENFEVFDRIVRQGSSGPRMAELVNFRAKEKALKLVDDHVQLSADIARIREVEKRFERLGKEHFAEIFSGLYWEAEKGFRDRVYKEIRKRYSEITDGRDLEDQFKRLVDEGFSFREMMEDTEKAELAAVTIFRNGKDASRNFEPFLKAMEGIKFEVLNAEMELLSSEDKNTIMDYLDPAHTKMLTVKAEKDELQRQIINGLHPYIKISKGDDIPRELDNPSVIYDKSRDIVTAELVKVKSQMSEVEWQEVSDYAIQKGWEYFERDIKVAGNLGEAIDKVEGEGNITGSGVFPKLKEDVALHHEGKGQSEAMLAAVADHIKKKNKEELTQEEASAVQLTVLKKRSKLKEQGKEQNKVRFAAQVDIRQVDKKNESYREGTDQTRPMTERISAGKGDAVKDDRFVLSPYSRGASHSKGYVGPYYVRVDNGTYWQEKLADAEIFLPKVGKRQEEIYRFRKADSSERALRITNISRDVVLDVILATFEAAGYDRDSDKAKQMRKLVSKDDDTSEAAKYTRVKNALNTAIYKAAYFDKEIHDVVSFKDIGRDGYKLLRESIVRKLSDEKVVSVLKCFPEKITPELIISALSPEDREKIREMRRYIISESLKKDGESSSSVKLESSLSGRGAFPSTINGYVPSLGILEPAKEKKPGAYYGLSRQTSVPISQGGEGSNGGRSAVRRFSSLASSSFSSFTDRVRGGSFIGRGGAGREG